MDVFHINDSSGISSTILDNDSPVTMTEIAEVKFEAHSEFDLNFFDTPDDSMTQAAFSSPNSVESSTSPTPEPIAIVIQQHHKPNMASNQPAMLLNIKNGKLGSVENSKTRRRKVQIQFNTMQCSTLLQKQRRKS